jgi:hypothetical protein
LLTLLPTILLICGKVNFTNLSRYSELSERTYRRQYHQSFAFMGLNAGLIAQAIPASAVQIAVMDCSFIRKSGKGTAGLDWFYNGSASRSETGLEIKVFAVVDVEASRGYTLSVQQTPANPVSPSQRRRKSSPQIQNQKTPVDAALIPKICAALSQLPPKPQVPDETTRIDHYLNHLKQTRPHLPQALKYLAGDGYYSKRKFVDGVCALDLHLISKLRSDANLRYLYSGPQKPRGRHRRYDGKVTFDDLTRFTWLREIEPGLNLYTALVYHVSLKRQIRIALLLDTRTPGKTGRVLLFCTDIDLDAEQILIHYQARFQIEFIFRDAKQFTGLCDCQSRNAQKLDFHFNAALSALNLAKYQAQLRHPSLEPGFKAEPFSTASHKRVALNQHLLERFIAQLDLDPTVIKSHPNYENLRSYGIIAA